MRLKMVFGTLVLLLLTLMLLSLVNAQTGMVSYWKFDEGSGTTASDSVDGHHGTIDGATWTTGKVGGALTFGGDGDYVKVPHSEGLNFGESSFTIEAWIKTIQPAGAWKRVVTKRHQGHPWHSGWYSLAVHGGKIVAEIWDGEPYHYVYLLSSKVVNDGAWHHIVVIKSDNTISIYIDGVFDVSCYFVLGDISNDAPLEMGKWSTEAYPHPPVGTTYDGLIDEVAIYNRALSPEEIQQNYALINLEAAVESLKLPKGIENSLVKKLEAAKSSLDRGNNVAAVNQLNAFINHVKAQRGKKLTEAEANSLIGEAEEIIASIESVAAPPRRPSLHPINKLATTWGSLKGK